MTIVCRLLLAQDIDQSTTSSTWLKNYFLSILYKFLITSLLSFLRLFRLYIGKMTFKTLIVNSAINDEMTVNFYPLMQICQGRRFLSIHIARNMRRIFRVWVWRDKTEKKCFMLNLPLKIFSLQFMFHFVQYINLHTPCNA